MEITQITQIVSQVGFPMFVALFFLLKGSKETADLRAAVQELTTYMKQQNGGNK